MGLHIFRLNLLCDVHINILSRATSSLLMSLYQSVSEPDLWYLQLKIFSTPNVNVAVLSGASCMLVVRKAQEILKHHSLRPPGSGVWRHGRVPWV